MASSTPQLVASTIASSAPALSPHLAASSVLSSPIFPPRMVSPSLVPTAAFSVVCQLCLRPGLQQCLILKVSLHSKLWGHRSLLVSRCLVPYRVCLSCRYSLKRKSHSWRPLLLHKETTLFQVRHLCFFSQCPVFGAGVAVPGVRFPGHAVVAPGSSLCIYVLPCNLCIDSYVSICCIKFC